MKTKPHIYECGTKAFYESIRWFRLRIAVLTAFHSTMPIIIFLSFFCFFTKNYDITHFFCLQTNSVLKLHMAIVCVCVRGLEGDMGVGRYSSRLRVEVVITPKLCAISRLGIFSVGFMACKQAENRCFMNKNPKGTSRGAMKCEG